MIATAFLIGIGSVRAANLETPAKGAYTGAYVDFGETEDHVTAKAIAGFETLVGKKQAIIGSSSFWGRGSFPAESVRVIRAGGAIPLLYWSPWGPPYEQGKHVDPKEFALRKIIKGECDSYIDRWAAAARAEGGPLLVSFACEPNSDWYPWSGYANGGGEAGPKLYKDAYRHAVDRVRAAGARNVTWVLQVNNDSHPEKDWNEIAQYYPGAAYVDWLGMSAYGQITPGKHDWTDWVEAVDEAYRALCALDPDKPIMLAEWGVGEFPDSGDKARWIRTAFEQMSTGKYPRLKAAVFWHERWQNHDESYSNLYVNSSPRALEAYRAGVSDPFWLERPIIGP